jgi:methylmalonyl-CoA/ethylmalonyl-CoA epimerase
MCFEVQDIEQARAFYGEKGVRILGPTRIGAHGTPIFFLHPKDMGGVLTEIMESPKQAH